MADPLALVPSIQMVGHQEKPDHSYFLQNFRVHKCPKYFEGYGCRDDYPFTCFNWHHPSQHRRVTMKKLDGSLNISSFKYCELYTQKTGYCGNGKKCPYLHSVVGDVEKKYHISYYKTMMCIYPADQFGICVQNGPFCGHAHQPEDLREPVLGQLATGHPEGYICSPTWLVWLEKSRIILLFKTEPCYQANCEGGNRCPFFHGESERRRNLEVHEYRPISCPATRFKRKWSHPLSCSDGDTCKLCHTMNELQFHPMVYRTEVCRSVRRDGECWGSVFCPFAHHPSEMRSVSLGIGTESELIGGAVGVKRGAKEVAADEFNPDDVASDEFAFGEVALDELTPIAQRLPVFQRLSSRRRTLTVSIASEASTSPPNTADSGLSSSANPFGSVWNWFPDLSTSPSDLASDNAD